MEPYYVIISACHSGHLALNLLVVGFISEMSAGLIMAGKCSAETRTIKCPLGCGAARRLLCVITLLLAAATAAICTLLALNTDQCCRERGFTRERGRQTDADEEEACCWRELCVNIRRRWWCRERLAGVTTLRCTPHPPQSPAVHQHPLCTGYEQWCSRRTYLVKFWAT